MEVLTPAAASTRSLVWGLALTQTVGWGVLFYSFPVVLEPMRDDLGWSRATLVGGPALATVVSGVVAPLIGRTLDRGHARALMTAGSCLGAALLIAWSQVTTVNLFYVVWACLGVAQAAVLYDAAFPVLIKRTAPRHAEALATVAVVAGLASFVFQPLTSALITGRDWRTAVLVLALVLAAATVPIHAAVLGSTGPSTRPEATRCAPRSPAPPPGFWAITAAFALVTMTTFSIIILLVAYLVDQTWTLSSAALAAGTLGLMQLPGRLAFSRMRARVPNRTLAPIILGLPAGGVALLLVSDGSSLVWPAIALLGTGQGALLLFRATLLVDLYGTEHIGRLNGVSALPVTIARALAPLGATLIASRHGYAPAFLVLLAFSAAGATLGHRTLVRSE